MKLARITRRTGNLLLMFSGLFNVYVLIFLLWDYGKNVPFIYRDIIDFWVPLVSCFVSLFFVVIGIVATIRAKNWGLAIAASIFTIITPIVWQMFPVTRALYVVIPRATALGISVITIILILLSKADFNRLAGTNKNHFS